MKEALEEIAAKQPEVLAMIERNGFVFTDLGREPGNWQHLAFTLYAQICEIDSIARTALEIIDCAETPLMRDVLAERDEARMRERAADEDRRAASELMAQALREAAAWQAASDVYQRERDAALAREAALRRERDDPGPFFVRDMARLAGLADDASMDAIYDALFAALADCKREEERWKSAPPKR